MFSSKYGVFIYNLYYKIYIKCFFVDVDIEKFDKCLIIYNFIL